MSREGMEVALLVVSAYVFLRMITMPGNKHTWLWVALYWATLTARNWMAVMERG